MQTNKTFLKKLYKRILYLKKIWPKRKYLFSKGTVIKNNIVTHINTAPQSLHLHKWIIEIASTTHMTSFYSKSHWRKQQQKFQKSW